MSLIIYHMHKNSGHVNVSQTLFFEKGMNDFSLQSLESYFHFNLKECVHGLETFIIEIDQRQKTCVLMRN